MTKAVILAAGVGSRFNSPKPKSLSQLNVTTTVLNHQIKCLSSRIGLENIWIVVGYKKNIIQKKFPKLNFVHNPKYLSTNTSKSLLLALEKIDDDVLCMVGDVYFDEQILDLLFNTEESSCLVNKNQCGDEEMKYNLDHEGFINEISKSVKSYQGEALGIEVIKRKNLNSLKNELRKIKDSDYISKALENLIKKKIMKLKPVFVGKLFCQEFDSQNDFDSIKKYFQNQRLISGS